MQCPHAREREGSNSACYLLHPGFLLGSLFKSQTQKTEAIHSTNSKTPYIETDSSVCETSSCYEAELPLHIATQTDPLSKTLCACPQNNGGRY
jgi:hypothetical protein